MKSYHVLKLEASNIKGIKAVVIKPKPGVITIEGNNGEGKSSALDAIEMALRGKKYCPSQPIRVGEKKGEITIELGDHLAEKSDFIVKRTFTEKGSYLKVTNKEGLEFKSSQSMLDALCGAMAFDPMEFTRLDAKSRSETLKKIAGLDFTDIEKEYKRIFEERTFAKRELGSLRSLLDEMPEGQELPIEDISEVINKRDAAIESNQKIKSMGTMIEMKKSNISSLKQKMQKLRDELQELQLLVDREELEVSDIYSQQKQMSLINIDELNKKVANHQERTQLANQYQQRQQKIAEHNEKKIECESYTEKLESLKAEKIEIMNNAKLPIDGLDFANGDITYNGIEFEQINTAEKIKISMCMAMALNPYLKIVRIMNGSLVDENSMKEIEKIASEKGFDIWIEKVSSEKTTDNSFLIKEGELSNG